MGKIILLFMGIIFITACEQSQTGDLTQTHITLSQRMGAEPDSGFLRATKVRDFSFPRDHAAHPDFATEWWYFTGNLQADDGADYGYQFTLFRVGLKPGQVKGDSSWRSHQMYMGHLAISDFQQKQHVSNERFARSAMGLAGAEIQPLRIWLGPWSIQGYDENLFPIELTADAKDISIKLTLQAGSKPLVLQGDRGLSRKGGEAGNASYYYSFTRLPTQGSIRIGNKNLQVKGNSWFDREWSSSALASDQAGWDWFSLQLKDGRDLMFYRMRDKKGKAQKFSNGVLVDVDGVVHPLSLDNVQLKPLKFWENSKQITYPLNWSLKIPQYKIDLRIDAVFEDQEMQHTVRYWEGAVRVSGSHDGVGYLELSGYE